MLFTGKNYKVRKREEETPRINAHQKRDFLSDKFYVDIQRARIVTESYKKSEGYPMVIRRAMAFKDIMENLDCVIQDNELIVGAQNGSSNRSASVFPDSRVDFIRDEIDIFETRAADRFIVRPEVKKELLEDIIPYWEDKCLHSNMLKTLPDETRRHQLAENQCVNGWCAFANGPGHYVPDHENLLKMGLKGKKEQAEKVLAEIDMCDKEGIRKMHDLQAMIMTIDAAITFAHRYAAKAREMAEKEADETRKKELIRIAETCEWVPENPPRNFYEATQFVWFTELITQIETNGVSIAPGNFDRYMLPYYEKDIADGTETQESIAEILGCFYIKLAEMVVLYDTQQSTFIANFAMGEHLSIGGTDKYGRDVTNELSYVCLQALGQKALILPTYCIIYLANYLCCLLFRKKADHSAIAADTCPPAGNEKEISIQSPLGEILDTSIMNGFESITKLGGYIILFSVFQGVIKKVFTPLGPVMYVMCGVTEMTTGITALAGTGWSLTFLYPMLLGITAFGGICVAAQTKSMLAGTDLSSAVCMAKAYKLSAHRPSGILIRRNHLNHHHPGKRPQSPVQPPVPAQRLLTEAAVRFCFC